MFEFTLADGNPVMVNLALVTHFQPSDDGTIIYFNDDSSVTVAEAYDAVAETLNPEKQAGC